MTCLELKPLLITTTSIIMTSTITTTSVTAQLVLAQMITIPTLNLRCRPLV